MYDATNEAINNAIDMNDDIDESLNYAMYDVWYYKRRH